MKRRMDVVLVLAVLSCGGCHLVPPSDHSFIKHGSYAPPQQRSSGATIVFESRPVYRSRSSGTVSIRQTK